LSTYDSVPSSMYPAARSSNPLTNH
jgi:hypothetical protein